MPRETQPNPWRMALDRALMQLAQAEHAFEWSDAEFSDYHAYRIQAAKEQVALILRQARRAYGYAPGSAMLPGSDAPALNPADFAQPRG